MKKKPFLMLFYAIFILANHVIFAQNDSLKKYCAAYNELNAAIRDSKIDKIAAKNQFTLIIPKIKQFAGQTKVTDTYFPLKGYKANCIGGKNGSGYIAKGYDFFSGNKHTAHPAHDIFIYDKNQDSHDDLTEKPVVVRSIGDGVVIVLVDNWEAGSELRSGIVVAIYDTFRHGIFYYVHNRKTFVTLGQKVKAGDKIAEVGRTGKNAYATRSPTHLHLMYLKLNAENLPEPTDTYNMLLKSKQ